MNWYPSLCILFGIVLAHMPVHAQKTVSFSESFDTMPQQWIWMGEYHDGTVDKEYGKGMNGGVFRVKHRGDGSGWAFRSIPVDARQDWTVTMDSKVLSATGTAGPGIHLRAATRHYFFKYAPARRVYWFGSYEEVTQTWTTHNAKPASGGDDVPCSCIQPIGSVNVLRAQRRGNALQLFINDIMVENLELAARLPELDGQLLSVGIDYSQRMEAEYLDFSATFVQHRIDYDSTAFHGATKQYATELNDDKGDRYAVLSPNGSSIYWVRSDKTSLDDIMVADRATDSTWTNVRAIAPPLNNRDANNVISASQDNNELFLWSRYNADGSPAGPGFSRTRRTAEDWEIPTNITINGYRNRSSTREECVSADRRVAILSCQADVTIGDKDLYVSFLQADGSYSEPRNLGPVVNSTATEGMPYLAADNRTLYFASMRPGFGDADIWVTKRLDDTWLAWTPPVNMGPTINGNGWDAYFSIHPSGTYAYMNSSDGYRNGIMKLKLPQDAASRRLLPAPTALVRGRVIDARTRKPLSAEISVTDLNHDGPAAHAVSEPLHGDYSILLPGERSYGFYATAPGYFPVSDNIDLASLDAYREVQRDLVLWPLEAGTTIRLNNVFFDTDKAVLRTESHEELRRLAALLLARPTMTIVLGGHTDDRASAAHNGKLSTDRAEAVRQFLISQAVPASRLTSRGYGKTRPVGKGTSEEARQQNRRVEFTITTM